MRVEKNQSSVGLTTFELLLLIFSNIFRQDDLGLALPAAKFLGTSTYSAGFIHPLDNARIRKDELMPPPKSALRKRPGPPPRTSARWQ